MNKNTRRITTLSLLVAVTIVLQIIATFLPIKLPGGLELSFVLIPVVVAACFYGVAGGAIVGGVFGLVVFIMGLTGATPFTTYLIFEVNWFYTVIGTVVRTTLAAVCVALVFKLVSKKFNRKISYYVASVCAPVFNTGIFVIVFLTLFNPVLQDMATENGYGGNVFGYVIVAFVGLNFLLELATTVLLAPPVCMAVEKALSRSK